MRAKLILGVALSLVVGSSGTASVAAQARTFKLDAAGGSKLQFVSDAPLETITGVVTKTDGEVTVDAASPGTAKGKVRAEIASIRTGIDLRDSHLISENWLDAAKQPYATFEIVSVTGLSALKPNEVVSATVKGKFSIHGKSRDVTAEVRVRWTPKAGTGPALGSGDQLRIQGSFIVKLTDYGISVPSVVRLKISDDIRVNLDLRATAT